VGLTHVTATDRLERRMRRDVVRVGVGDVVLLVTSLVAAAAITLAYAGRTRAAAWSIAHDGVPAAIVNLSTVRSAGELEPIVMRALESVPDSTFAARALFQFLAPPDGRVRPPNVGSLTRISVPVDAILRNPRLVVYGERVRTARARAAASGQPPPATIPLFTSADLTTLKPLLSVRTREAYARTVLWCGLVYLAGFQIVSLFWRRAGIAGDRLLLSAVHLLTAIGFAVLLSRSDPLRDTLLVVRFTLGIVTGLVALAIASSIDFRKKVFGELSYVPLAIAGVLCILLIVFGTGPGSSGAKVNLGPAQPIEAIRLLLALFLAGYFASRWELLRNIRSRTFRLITLPSFLNVPRLVYVLPVVTGVAVSLGFFFLQKDLGPALFLSFVFLSMYAVARRKVVLAIGGLALLVAGFYAGYRLHISDTLADRVRIWQSPWDNVARGGDQVAHAYWALAAGAGPGTGLGLGDTRYVPAGHTDLALAAVGEELGAAGLLIVAALYGFVVWRGFRIARNAPGDYAVFLALAVTLTLIVPVLVMAAGILGVIPLTGVVTPFLSYGGSAMAANLAAVGILAAISRSRSPAADTEPFRAPLRTLGVLLTASAIALLAIVINVQLAQRDNYLVRPQLTLQADGGRRYVYNPRVLDVVRQIPRGTISDRDGLPLASSDAASIRKASDAYKHLGVAIDDVCPDRDERCYPLGGIGFHILGDARNRLNWSATNSSYVERDADDRLRGFDDRATTVKTIGAHGEPILAVRRDYHDVISLVRHRYEPSHPEVTAILSRPRDVRLSIDASLQLRVAAILSRYARASATGNAAAVVLDADTGEILAAVSHPWPDSDATVGRVAVGRGFSPGNAPTLKGRPARADAAGEIEEELLDRARYGLYPPGSTFKMVTAAAALEADPGLATTQFVCSRLPDGRVGARVPGLGRPIRDDVLDTHPHGVLDMREALVVSCNAYFAQLALRLGRDRLIDAGTRAGVSVAVPRENERDALAHAGFGQGQVLVTPLKMARIAAALGTDGLLRGPMIEPGDAEHPSTGARFVTAQSAHLLADTLRDVVLRGTGRPLRTHAARIAGKTGTAQVAGSPSHAWFVGFAPYGSATKRIAFAVILENAGYGGANAAAAAGDIVSAAASRGFVGER
jgi:cell division protein FtsW (lipid II flippase)